MDKKIKKIVSENTTVFQRIRENREFQSKLKNKNFSTLTNDFPKDLVKNDNKVQIDKKISNNLGFTQVIQTKMENDADSLISGTKQIKKNQIKRINVSGMGFFQRLKTNARFSKEVKNKLDNSARLNKINVASKTEQAIVKKPKISKLQRFIINDSTIEVKLKNHKFRRNIRKN